jgi:Ca2+-transporting ATPase
MDRITEARIVASSPGRLRIEIPALHRSAAMKSRLEARFGHHPAVTEVCASTLTGRVLLLFRPGVKADALLAELAIEAAPRVDAARGASREVASAPRPSMYPAWHLRGIDEALAYHGSSTSRGLSQREARQRLRQGSNLSALPKRRTSLDILLKQFKGVPVALLGISAAVSLVTGALAEAAALGAVLIMNAAIGFRTERQAERSIASLSELVDDQVLVLRDGAVAPVAASQIVPGDVVQLGPGSRIAADLRLLRSDGLKIDESLLTGESGPVDKQVAALVKPRPLAERSNMAYRGTAVASGTGLGLAVGTGIRTEAGAVEALTRATERPKTPIQIQLDHLGNQLVGVSTALCLGVIGIGLLRGHQRAGLLRSALALAVAAIPEGLPAVATSSLAKGLRRMRERHVLIRHLHAVETLGTISTICLDKTGTLTMNQMSAVAIRTVRHGFDPTQLSAAAARPGSELERLLQVCVLCNEAQVNGGQSATAPQQGSSTEAALLELARHGGAQEARLRARYPLLDSELRAEGRNYMRTTHATARPGRHLVLVKGSPAEVLAMCTHYLDDGRPVACDEATRTLIVHQNDKMAREGLRVLAFAYAESAAGDDGADMPPLTWLGLVGLADPLRPGVADAIARFHAAGIRTIMLTGDQAGTAYQIGKALRLGEDGALNIVNSDELDQMPPSLLRARAAQAHIFSRVTPSDKLRIVQALQATGATVAMTGDGINDSPALRAADVGIAMGSGTDVALAVADVALKYDQLDSVLDAVAQGRSISDNIRKSVHFLVSSNLSEILAVLGTVALGTGSPLTPLQLLWLNLLNDVLPAIALAEEASETDVMQRRLRDRRAPLVDGQDMLTYAREAGLLAAGTLGAYAYGLLRHASRERAGALAFNTMVLNQLFHADFCRSERQPRAALQANPRLAAASLASVALQALAHLVPGLRRLLGLSMPGLLDMLAIAAGSYLPRVANQAAMARAKR